MAITDSESSGLARLSSRGLAARLSAWRRDGSDRAVAQRNAGSAVLIRSARAGLIYLTQVGWLPGAGWAGFEFGVYVYAWAWVGFLGMCGGGRHRVGAWCAALHSRVSHARRR